MSASLPLFLDVTVALPTMTFSKVRRYVFTDELNTIPTMVVEVFATEPDLDMTTLLGQSASVKLNEPTLPRFDGLVRKVEQRTADASGVSLYALTVVPGMWLLTERCNHRIFQKKTALGIVDDLIAGYGAAVEKPEGVIFQHVLREHEYRVQWGETDEAFLFRVLSEEGLVSCWSPNQTGERLWVLTDDTTAGGADMELPFRPAAGSLAAAGPHVSEVMVNARVCASEVKERDYDYEKPSFLLEVQAEMAESLPREKGLCQYSAAVGRFNDHRGGGRLAQIRLEQARVKSRSYRWEMSVALRPGMKVKLHDHPREDANGEFLVVSAWTEVEASTKKHVAMVVPGGAAWRPTVRPKPRIQGTQTAIVVGAPGQEIDVDEQGRVEVEFHWDTRDLEQKGASRRVRVAMPWMGTDRGFWTLPRVGDEVVVAYLDGDPDEPLIVGSVNNAVAPPAASLPANQTQSWWKSKSTGQGDGYNAILMEDREGQEVLALRAERDFSCDATRNSVTNIGGSAALSVVKGQSVEVGGDATISIKGHCKVHAGSVEVHTDGELNFNANGARNDSSGAFNYTSAPFVYVVGTSEVEISGGEKLTLKVGGASITLEDGKITLSAMMIELNP